MGVEELLVRIETMVEEGLDFDAIKIELDKEPLEKEDRNGLLLKADELIFHRALEKEYRSKAWIQIIMGAIFLAFPLLIAFLAYDKDSKIIYIWYGAALIGAWNLKEGYKKYKTPFEPPTNFGYSRKKFQRF